MGPIHERSRTLSIISPGLEGNNAAKFAISNIGTNTHLYQGGVSLEPNTRYKLSYAAYSTSGSDLYVALIKQVSPYSNYGLSYTLNIGTGWQTFSTEFTTKGFTGTVNDGYLYFWTLARDTYYIDNIRLEKVNAPVLPTITTQPQDQTVDIGQTATFSVAATGTSPLTYQWQEERCEY